MSGAKKYAAASTIFDQWLDQNPDDTDILFHSGFTLHLQAEAEPNDKRSRKLHRIAYERLTKAHKLGCKEVLLPALLNAYDTEGKPLSREFSSSKEAQALMQKGEKAFGSGKLNDALAFYQRALDQDPRNYHATLFIGDIHFNRGQYDDAITWFEKAASIQPHIETAHRYCGDAYAKTKRPQEALAKYIDAFIAEPYNRIPFEMLKRWAAQNQIYLKRRAINLPVPTVEIKDKEMSIGCDPADGALVLLYSLARGKWLSEERAAFFAEDATPRHSLPEERSGLEAVLTFADEASGAELKEELSKWKSAIDTLREVKKAGLLDTFILLDRANQGIAQDYSAYRETNRAELVRYIREIWFGQK
ncbi:tetratricopeptide repeat protein [Nibricoccus aquaticus]|uniref:tetratricopeptide repeat protein n=1 Tax=Nibricoccus aquaticus TaxID=2576891 RepID=UPI001585D63E|nr:tetratricopeptide repeat protein [Nibricoccus aquaticus]